MLIGLQMVMGTPVEALGGTVGSVADVYFDSFSWDLRYLVVDTGKWRDRQVLLAPQVVEHADWPNNLVQVKLTREQVENSPHVETDKPVSRQQELELVHHFGWQPYWAVGPAGLPAATNLATETVSERSSADGNPYLHSASKWSGTTAAASDGDLGTVEDQLLDTQTWLIRYLVINAGSWLDQRRLLLSVAWIDAIDWKSRTIHFNLPQEKVVESPHYQQAGPVERTYEEALHTHYGGRRYWQPADG